MEESEKHPAENREPGFRRRTRTPAVHGGVCEYGINNSYADGGVRPAMRILPRV